MTPEQKDLLREEWQKSLENQKINCDKNVHAWRFIGDFWICYLCGVGQ